MATLASRITDLAGRIRDKFNEINPRLTPTGGAQGRVLGKASAADHDTEWVERVDMTTTQSIGGQKTFTTGADVLAPGTLEVKVGSSGASGVDAKLTLQGARTGSATAEIGALNFRNNTSLPYDMARVVAKDPDGAHSNGMGRLIFQTADAGVLADQFFLDHDGSATFYQSVTVQGGTVWHGNNDGPGSGMDADLLDGNHASAFAFLTGATFTGGIVATTFDGDGSLVTGVDAEFFDGFDSTSFVRSDASSGQTINVGGGDFILAQNTGGVNNVVWWDSSAAKLLLGTVGSGGGVIEPRVAIVGTTDLTMAAITATGNVTIDTATTPRLEMFSSAEDTLTFGMYDKQAVADQYFEIRYDASASNTAHFDVNGTNRITFPKTEGVTVNTSLTMAGTLNTNGQTLYLNNGVIASHNNDGGAAGDHTASTNLDHIWHDDATNAWHFVSDSSYKVVGNAELVAGRLGLGGARADASNPFAFYGTNMLLNSGSDINMKFNKSAAGDDASLTFQQGFATQALFGLLANNDLTIKVGAAFTTALVIDNATGEVSMPATPPAKFTINKSGRAYFYAADDRWVTSADDNYGPSYYQYSESAGTGADPIQEWEHMGEYVREGTVVYDLSILGRITDTANIADMEILISFTAPSAMSRWDTTGLDNDGEDVHTELWRGFWKAGGTGVAAFTHPVNDQHRRKFDLNFTCPTDGQLRIYYKPVSVDPRPDVNNDYFLHTYSWLLSYA